MFGGYELAKASGGNNYNQLPELNRLSNLFKVLADETRLKIVYILLRQELSVGDIAGLLGSTPSNVSHHLRLLRAARLVKRRRDGKLIYYTLDDEHVEAIIEQGFYHIAHD